MKCQMQGSEFVNEMKKQHVCLWNNLQPHTKAGRKKPSAVIPLTVFVVIFFF